MKSTKQLGIWMDHSIAHLMELTNETIATNTIESKPALQAKKDDLIYKDESHVLNKEQNKLSTYYKKLSEAILKNDEVILFGPTEAKNELLNLLKDDHRFENIKITVKSADKMTENQQQAFVREFFQTLDKH